MTNNDNETFELYVRSQLSAILIIVQNVQQVLDSVDGKSDKIVTYTEELNKTMSALVPLHNTTNFLLLDLTKSFKEELKQTREDLKDANKDSSKKLPIITIGWMVAFMLISLAVINRYSFEGIGLKVAKEAALPIVQKLDDNNKEAAQRSAETRKVFLDAKEEPADNRGKGR